MLERLLPFSLLLCAAAGCRETPPPEAPRPTAAKPSGALPSEAAPSSVAPREVPSAAAGSVIPESLGEATLEQAEALERANEAIARGDLPRGREALQVVISGPPSAARTSALMAMAFSYESSDPAQATRWYEQLVDAAPTVPEVWFAVGRHRGAQEDHAGSISAFEQALRLSPDLLPVYPLLGAQLLQQKKRTELAELMAVYEMRLKALVDRVKSAEEPLESRMHVLELFALLDDERGQETLIELLKDPLAEIRVAAASALAELGEPEGLEAIAKATVAEQDAVARQLLTHTLQRARRRVEQSTP